MCGIHRSLTSAVNVEGAAPIREKLVRWSQSLSEFDLEV